MAKSQWFIGVAVTLAQEPLPRIYTGNVKMNIADGAVVVGEYASKSDTLPFKEHTFAAGQWYLVDTEAVNA